MKNLKPGFTLVELLLAALISSMLAGLTAASYLSVSRQTGRGEEELLLAQNARAVIDRISRDVRQAVEFAVAIPEQPADGINRVEFEDGHQISPNGPTYIEYEFVSNTGEDTFKGKIWRRQHYYYIDEDPSVRLPYDSVLGGGMELKKQVLEAYVIAEDVTNLDFYGSEGLLEIDVDLQIKQTGQSLEVHSAVAKRN